ncbi:MAG: choice-of-anchor L domain-containing protein, partial [Olleya sp.]
MKKTTFILALLFLLTGWQANSQTYLQENFNASIPATWTITDAGAATGDSWISGIQGGFSSLDGTNAAIADSDANGNGTLLLETLTSPVFDASAATALFLDFDQYYRNIGADNAIVEVFDGTAWVEVLNQTASIGGFNAPDQQHIDITAYANANMQVRFIYNDADSWAWYWLIDNVLIYNATCPNPSGLTLDAVTSTSVDLSWTLGGTEAAWEVVVQPAGTGAPTGAGSPATDNTLYTDNTLTPATDYEVYVRANCGADLSIWTGPITFTTDCAIFTPTYLQDFTTIPANCWEVANNGDSTTGPTDLGTSSWANDGYLNNGFTGAYKINLWLAEKSDWLLSPEIDLTGVPYQVEFDFGVMTFGSTTTAGTLGSDDTVELMITTDNGTTWTVLETFDATSVIPATGLHVVQNLTAYSGTTAQFGIRASEGTVDDPTDNDVFVDNFQVRAVPSCPDPLAVTATATGDTTADITWDAGSTETEWQIWIQPAGTGEPTTDGVVTSLNAPYPATGLTPSTPYEVYVRANCGTDGYSVWIGPVNFTTLNTPPPAPVGVSCASGASSTIIFTEDFGNDTNYVPSGWTGTTFADINGDWDITTVNGNSGGTGPNITWDGNAGTHLEYEGSGNTTNVASAITPAIDLSTAVDGAELSFWMHAFGDNMGTLNIGVSTSQTGPFTSEYTWIGDYQSTADEAWVPIGINLDAYLGQIIYIEISYVGTGDTFESDMAIDQVRVETCGDFCVAPTGITVDAITDTTADVSWTANNGETNWEIVVQPAGTGVPTGSGTPITTNPYTLTGLTASTVNEVYILSDCGNGLSVWAGPINFTTLNTPPPAPVGVTCTSGASTFIFTEDFGNDTNYVPAGWTGTAFTDTNGDWDITTVNANSTGTGPNITWDGNAGTHLEYEGSGNTTNVASAITPAIDLSTAVDGAELSFWMHAFGDNMGTLNIGVSTSQTGPFTTEYTWIGDYQSTADEAWVPIGVNLDAYLGQIVYIEISYVGTGDIFESDMAIDQVRVEACGNFCVAPSNITATSITETSADISWTSNGTETEWNYVIQPAGTGIPTSGTLVTTTTISETGLNPATDYEIYVQSICGADTSTWAGPFTFSTLLQFNFTLDCATDGPQTINYCYESNDTNIFTFSSTDGTALNITFNSGQVEQGWDELIVFDTDGTTDLNALTPYGNNGDVSGLTYQSSGDTISFTVQSDGVFDCGSQGYTPLTVTVNCATCINPVVDFSTTTDCSAGNNQFFVNVDITSIGDALSLNITDNQSTPLQNVMTSGIITMGPYPLDTDVVVTVANADDTNCIVTSSTLNVPVCPPVNDDCLNAIIVTPNADENCTNTTSATLYGATTSTQTNVCTGTANDDVWFQFDAVATDHGIDISNIVGDTVNLNHALYEGPDCDSLTNIYCEATNNSIANGLTIGNTYYIRIYTDGDIPFQDVNFDLCVFTIPPPITTNDTQYTVQELVTDVLVNSPCALINNVTWSTGTDFGTTNGIGYFEANGSSFPFQSGIVMTTGNVLNAPGPETGVLSEGGGSWPGDADLEAFINTDLDGNPGDDVPAGGSNNASLIEFEFTPLIDQLSFNFIFAAEEYGTFQCGFSDAFAFLLTDLTTGNVTNLAVIPGTSDPVSVLSIRDDAYNTSCASSNPTLFDAYYGAGGLPAITNPTNFIGRTVPLTATSAVIPNNPYSIKLVIADDGDTIYDSAVFLEASSFDIGNIDLGNDILISNGLATCEGDSVTLDLGIAPPTNATITWYAVADGITDPIAGENGTSLVVTEQGLYQVDITFTDVSSACFYTDQILVEFFPKPEIETGIITDISACDPDDSGVFSFDLTIFESAIYATQNDIAISYYLTEQNAIDAIDAFTNPTSFTSAPTTIYIRLENTITGCFETTSFNLLFNISPETSFNLDVPYEVCPNATSPIAITADAINYIESEVSIKWYNEGVEIAGQTGLSLNTVLTAGEYEIEVTFNDTGCSKSEFVTVVELENCTIPQGISPGVSPGLNDNFDLSSFDVQSLEI